MKTVNTQAVASNQEIRGNVTSNRLRKILVTKTDDSSIFKMLWNLFSTY
jgi:hypothetical protein